MLFRSDGGLLISSLEALGIGFAAKIATHLPIPTGVGLKDSQFGRVVGYGRNRLRYGKTAVPLWEKAVVICSLLFIPKLHSYEHICS